MTPKELSAKIAEIEKCSGHFQRDRNLALAEDLAELVADLPPGILAAMCEVAVTREAFERDWDESGTEESDITRSTELEHAYSKALAAFRALLTKEPA